MKNTYKLSVEWSMSTEVEIEASSYEGALELLDSMSMEELNRNAEYIDGSFENNVQMNLFLNENNEMLLEEIEEHHGTKL